MDILVREALEDDVDWILALNAANVPDVGGLTLETYLALEDQCHAVLIAEDASGERLGMIMLVAPGHDYDSVNYRWFEEKLNNFLYVDRVMVAEAGRRKGVGLALYSEALEMAEAQGAENLTAEVNVTPPNPTSMAFHERLGFAKMGEQDTPGGKSVAMLCRKTLYPEGQAT